MRTRWFSETAQVLFGGACAALLLVAVGSGPVFAADRVVIAEHFTDVG